LAFPADFLALPTTGKMSAASTAMMAMTVNISLRVNADRERVGFGLIFTMRGLVSEICIESAGITAL
jgi:hypothetical protein